MSLPVRNLKAFKAFFAELGFTFSPDPCGPDLACMVIGEYVRVLLLAEDRFRDCINGGTRLSGSAGEVLICLPACSEREVDEIVTRAIVVGGKPWPVVYERPVYSWSFQDPDGHLWQVACPREPAHQEPAVAGAPGRRVNGTPPMAGRPLPCQHRRAGGRAP
jgi:predicted lactoylglutathione lyase